MSCYQVDKFLRDINHDRALAERWRAESGAVLERYDLPPMSERRWRRGTCISSTAWAQLR
jgi:hypothetical protein